MQHQRYVKSLYKRSLKLASDWYWQRAEFREKALIIRQLFEQNRHVENPKQIQQLLMNTEHLLAAYYHPTPYIPIDSPNGTKWERNLTVPKEILDIPTIPHDTYS